MMKASLFLLLCLPTSTDANKDHDASISALFSDLNSEPCTGNAVVSSWCDSSVMDVNCLIHPTLDMYACRCTVDPKLCPEECVAVEGQDAVSPIKTHHGIMCQGIPQDEPNYVLKNKDVSNLPLHHCENNAVVANWCNEATGAAQVDCLLLQALDEYVCTCMKDAAACPSECIGGGEADRKTKHAVRCRGIPEDKPNYVV